MTVDAMRRPPNVTRQPAADGARLALSGDWTLVASQLLEEQARRIVEEARRNRLVAIDLSQVSQLDTAGAWLINRARQELAQANVAVALEHARPEYVTLLDEAHYRAFAPPHRPRTNLLIDLLADLGQSMADGFREFYRGVGFLGEFVVSMAYVAARPGRFQADLARRPNGADRLSQRADHRAHQYSRRRHRRAAGHIPAAEIRRVELYRRASSAFWCCANLACCSPRS